MGGLFKQYSALDANIMRLFSVAFSLNVINCAFFLILNIFMSKSGYDDPSIATFWSARFFFVLIFAVPFGRFIQNRKIRPLILLSVLIYPLACVATIEAVDGHYYTAIYLGMMVMGGAESMLRISAAPYILRNLPQELHTRAFSMNFATWSGGLIAAGLTIFGLKSIFPELYHEKWALEMICLFSIIGVFASWQLKRDEHVPVVDAAPSKKKSAKVMWDDWGPMLRAATPTLVIAVGAGLTIPFINLFFHHSFGMDSDQFALLGTATHVLVLLGALIIPQIKDRYGYESITVTQSLSVLALVLLASSDFLHGYSWALVMAIACYMFRQPLMSIANPMTTEMTMYYVGEKNREMMSAVSSSIWSGSWFFSSLTFRFLRESGLRYGNIFLITAGLYAIGVFLYFLLIRDYRRRIRDGVIQLPA